MRRAPAVVILAGTVDPHRPAPLQCAVLELAQALQDRDLRGRPVDARPVLLADPPDTGAPTAQRLKALSAGLASVIRETRPDVVHTLSGSAGLAAMSAVPTGTPFVHSPLGRIRPGGRADDPSRLERLLLRKADRVIASSRAEADVLVTLGRQRRQLDIVPYVVPAGFSPEGPALPRPEGVRRVVTLSRSWGPDSAVDAVVGALRGLPDVELLVAGGPARERVDDDPDADRLLRLARQAGVVTRLLGHVPHPEVPALLRSADLVVVPPRWVATGAVAVEAMACGVPVVVTAGSGGAAEVVVEGMTGVIVGDADPARLRREVRDLLDDPMRRTGYTMASRSRLAARHDGDAVAAQLLRAYGADSPVPVAVPIG